MTYDLGSKTIYTRLKGKSENLTGLENCSRARLLLPAFWLGEFQIEKQVAFGTLNAII